MSVEVKFKRYRKEDYISAGFVMVLVGNAVSVRER
jgi:hypothetical protein